MSNFSLFGWIMLLMCYLIQFSFADGGRDVGNGGDVVLCPEGAEIYDYYEGRVRDGRVYDLGSSNLGLFQKVDLLINRIGKFDAVRAKRFKEWASQFMSDSIFLRDIELIDVPDTGNGFVPAHCQLKQLATQYEDPLRLSKRYTINQNYWDMLSVDQRAGLIFHELWLRDVIYNQTEPHKDSRSARFLNALISDKNFEKLSWLEYLNLMIKNKITSISNLEGFELALDDRGEEVKVRPEGYISVSAWAPFQTIDVSGVKFPVEGSGRFVMDSATGSIISGPSRNTHFRYPFELENNWRGLTDYIQDFVLSSPKENGQRELLGIGSYYVQLFNSKVLGSDAERCYVSLEKIDQESWKDFYSVPKSTKDLWCKLSLDFTVNGVKNKIAEIKLNENGSIKKMRPESILISFRQQSINVEEINVDVESDSQYRVTGEIIVSKEQKLKTIDRKKLHVIPNDKLVVDYDGLITSCWREKSADHKCVDTH